MWLLFLLVFFAGSLLMMFLLLMYQTFRSKNNTEADIPAARIDHWMAFVCSRRNNGSSSIPLASYSEKFVFHTILYQKSHASSCHRLLRVKTIDPIIPTTSSSVKHEKTIWPTRNIIWYIWFWYCLSNTTYFSCDTYGHPFFKILFDSNMMLESCLTLSLDVFLLIQFHRLVAAISFSCLRAYSCSIC